MRDFKYAILVGGTIKEIAHTQTFLEESQKQIYSISK